MMGVAEDRVNRVIKLLVSELASGQGASLERHRGQFCLHCFLSNILSDFLSSCDAVNDDMRKY